VRHLSFSLLLVQCMQVRLPPLLRGSIVVVGLLEEYSIPPIDDPFENTTYKCNIVGVTLHSFVKLSPLRTRNPGAVGGPATGYFSAIQQHLPEVGVRVVGWFKRHSISSPLTACARNGQRVSGSLVIVFPSCPCLGTLKYKSNSGTPRATRRYTVPH
jgi:hypothetical protein